MPDVTITGLPDASLPLDGAERVPMDKAGVTVDAPASAIAATLPDATTGSAGKMTAADKTKLDSVASGATANAADADLRDRATHTGTQAAGTITGLATVATTGAYVDLSGSPTLGTAAATDATAYATAAQGALANTATQPGDLGTAAGLDSGTGPGNVVILDGSSRLPAVDGSQLINLPPGGASDLDGLTDVTITAPATDQVLKYDGSGWVNAAAPGGGGGTVTSVAATVPTGLVVTGTPITTTGTLALAFDTGYSLPTDAEQADWDTAFSERAQWDGGATGLTPATGRASLGLGTAALSATGDFATAAQGTLADSATQPGDLATVATTGAYGDLSGLPTLGTAAALDVGTGASNVVQLDGSSRLPAVDGSQLTNLPGGASAHVIQEEGTPLTQRANLNFVGASVTATDDAGNDATVITITAGGGGGDALTADPLSQFAATPSAQLAGVITDETGSGSLVFSTGPSLVTPSMVSPDIGTPTAGNLALCTNLPLATGLSGLGTGVSAALASNTGSTGAVVLFNGALGAPSSGDLGNCTGLPISTGVSGLGAGIAAALASNTGSVGAPVLFNGAGGTPSSVTLTNATGLPWATGVTGKPTTLSGYGITDAQPLDSDLTAIAALTTTADGRSLLAATALTAAGLGLANGAAIDTIGANGSAFYLARANHTGTQAGSTVTGAYTAAGLTLSTARLLGRTTAATGAAEEISIGAGLILTAGTLSATGGGGGYADDNYAIPANILQPQATGPELSSITTTTNGVVIGTADFDGTTVEVANFSDMRPKNWDGTNPTARFVWQAGAGGTGAVTWGIAITAINEDDTPDVAPVFTEVNDAVVTDEEDQITAATAAIAIQGTLTADSRLQFWIRRNPADGGDTMSADARLISTVLTFALS